MWGKPGWLAKPCSPSNRSKRQKEQTTQREKERAVAAQCWRSGEDQWWFKVERCRWNASLRRNTPAKYERFMSRRRENCWNYWKTLLSWREPLAAVKELAFSCTEVTSRQTPFTESPLSAKVGTAAKNAVAIHVCRATSSHCVSESLQDAATYN